MNNKSLYFLLIIGVISLFWACHNDQTNNPPEYLIGKWIIVNVMPQAMPVEGSNLSSEELADSLLNYTFLPENTEIIFDSDSIRLTAAVPGYTLPLSLPYHYRKNIVSIEAPSHLPFWIEGTVQSTANVMQYILTPSSYISILDFIKPSFRDQVLSANVTYELKKAE